MDDSTKLLARSIAVVAGGLFSWIMIDLVISNTLKYYLAQGKFDFLLILAGVLMGIIVLLKVLALMNPAGATHAHDHDHDHGHGHDHEHGSVSFWRYVVLAIPLMINLMGMVPKQLDLANWVDKKMTAEQRAALEEASKATLPEGRSTGGEIRNTDARRLQQDALTSQTREYWESTSDPVRAKVSGQVVMSGSDNRYTLMRIKITCCVNDTTPVDLTVLGELDPKWKGQEWIEVVGPISFHKIDEKGKVRYLPILHQQMWNPTTQKDYIQ